MDDEKGKDDNEAGSSAGPMLFKKRNKVRRSLAATSSSAGLNREPILQDEEENAGQSVLRTAGLKGRRSNQPMGTSAGTRANNGKGVKLQFGEEEGDASNSAFITTKRSDLAQSITLPASLAQASIGDDEQSNSVYSPASLAALKAATPNLRRINEQGIGEDGHHQAERKIMSDMNADQTLNGESIVRQKYGADFAHEGIPSEAVINAAKEKRRRAMEAASTTKDFISINDEEGPHPESRIVREDDGVGSGEEEFAEFTGATERIALDEEGIKREKALERERWKEEVELDHDEEMSDDSGKEWEEAQMQREMANSSSRIRKEHSKDRERSPFKPTPIPQSATLPTLNSTSARLQDKIVGLQAEMMNQDALQQHANTQLAELRSDEERNKADTETAAEREAWFREFEQFIVSMATFLEEKIPKLDDVETDWIGHLLLRTKMIQQARADALTDQISLFYGVPSTSLLPKQDHKEEDAPRAPIENGGGLSTIRQARRVYADAALCDQLSSADQAAFEIAQHGIVQRANDLLNDVQAAEYREPAARTIKDDEHGQHTVLHPASLVARFHRWRRTYPQDYSNAWGGLTLASIWDFWLRKSLCGWDMLRLKDQQVNSFDKFKWYTELMHYMHKAQQRDSKLDQDGDKMEEDEGETTALGGDDEVISHAFTNTVIPALVRVIEKGAFDPWNQIHNKSALDLMEEMSYVMEKDNIRFQSLITSFLHQFQKHIDPMINALTLTPAAQAPAMASDAPNALFQCVQFISITITQNLIGWHRFVLASQRPFLQDLTNELIGKAIIPLLDMAKHIVGGKEMVQKIAGNLLRKTARPALLNDQNRSDLERIQTL
jgi:GC-rich sequence DNA-binding factor